MNFIEDILERYPAAQTALVTIAADGSRREWPFGELIARSAGLSGAFADRGVGRGDVVMTLVGNRIEWVLSLLACWRMGAVALPMSTQLRDHDVELRCEITGPALCVAADELAGLVPAGVPVMSITDVADALDEDRPQPTPSQIAELAPDDGALVVFTSGTTGEPRAAVHSQRYLPGQRTQAEHWLGARPGDLVWCTTATGWSKSTRNVFVAPWLCGASALLHEGRFDPDERLDLIERERVSVLCQSPTEYRMIAKRARLRALPSVRRMVSAGEPLNADVITAFEQATGCTVSDGYGQTETGHVTGNLVGEEIAPGSMGRPLPGLEVRVADGELQVLVSSCATFFDRYLGEDPFAGEWWPTGDLVSEDVDGRLWFEGRRDDVIVSSGYRIGPFEVESALISHPAIVEAAAVSVPDPERGSIVKAFVVTRPGTENDDALIAELQNHVKQITAPYKFPRLVEFTDELPKTASGKIMRAELRDRT